MPERRFPPPWTVEELNAACFIVRDSNGQQLAYVHFEDEPGRRSAAKSDRGTWRRVVEGLENGPRALIGLLRGENFGKLLVRVAR